MDEKVQGIRTSEKWARMNEYCSGSLHASIRCFHSLASRATLGILVTSSLLQPSLHRSWGQLNLQRQDGRIELERKETSPPTIENQTRPMEKQVVSCTWTCVCIFDLD